MAHAQTIVRSTQGDTLPDILERVLSVGVVIAGDIKIKLCDIELLSIQIRLLVCSVEKAQELGIPWWWQPVASSDGRFSERQDPAASAAPFSKAPAGPHQPLPELKPETRTPWEEYQKFQEFQRFREAMRAFED
jgi:hypothetical protein